MQLRLQFPPTPENAGRLAQLVMPAAKQISGVDLDYSPNSLHVVDQIVDGFHRDGVTLDRIGSTLFCFGCYVGQVFVRNNGGRWRATDEAGCTAMTDLPLVVQLGPDNFCNPIGKVFKRLENGEEDNLPYFYQVFTQGEGAPHHPPQKPSFWNRLFGDP